jgi:hypothetical protein
MGENTILDKYPELRETLKAAKYKLQADLADVRAPVPPVPVVLPTQPEPKPQKKGWPTEIKIWPLVGLAAINENNGGAWRAWRISHSLDHKGIGKVEGPKLRAYFEAMGLRRRNRQRWMAAALKIGLIRECRDDFYLVSLAKAAVKLGADVVGKPAKIPIMQLVRSDWRSYVWNGFLVTLKEQPISQEVKEAITGVNPRTQYNYQQITGARIRNYVDKGRADTGRVEGLRDVCGLVVFETKRRRIKQRLPDSLIVKKSISEICPKGRSRKAQKHVSKVLCKEAQVPPRFLKLFHERAAGVKKTLRDIARLDTLDRPGEIFERVYSGRGSTEWIAINTGI